MNLIPMKKEIAWVIKNWGIIPDRFKSSLKPDSYYGDKGAVPGLGIEEHVVIMLLDRQKPSVERCYNFDEERIGITKTGKIIWGFDSGCSCPSPWEDSYPNCYKVSKEWREFEIKTEDFDTDWEKDMLNKISEIKKSITDND